MKLCVPACEQAILQHTGNVNDDAYVTFRFGNGTVKVLYEMLSNDMAHPGWHIGLFTVIHVSSPNHYNHTPNCRE